MPDFIITTGPRSINGPAEEQFPTSRRRSRAIRHARKLQKAGNRNVMLFESINGSWRPVSIRLAESPKFASNNGCNSVRIESTLEESVKGVKMTFARVRHVGRPARKSEAAA